MASVKMSTSGNTSVIDITADVIEHDTWGSTREVTVSIYVQRVDFTGGTDIRYTVSGGMSDSGSVATYGSPVEIASETMTVSVNSSGYASLSTITVNANCSTGSGNRSASATISGLYLTSDDDDEEGGSSGGGGGSSTPTEYRISLYDGGYIWDYFPSNTTLYQQDGKSISLPQPYRNPTTSSTETFTITGKANGGNNNTTLTATKTNTTTYTFDGWYDRDYNKTHTTSYDDDHNANLYAKQSSNQTSSYSNNTLGLLTKPTRSPANETFTINYNGNGGTSTKSSDTATRQVNYEFAYWCSDSSGNGTRYTDTASFTSNSEVYATWTITSDNVTTINLPTATRQGYTFLGWAETPSSEYFITNTYTPSNSVTLYAQWATKDDIVYTINHHIKNVGNNTYTNYLTQNKTGSTGATIVLQDLKLDIEGFTYKEGKVDGVTTISTTIKSDGTLAINLYYNRNTYTVSIAEPLNVQDVTGSGVYEYEASVTTEVIFDTRMYHFSKWISSISSLNITSNPGSFIMPAENVSLTPEVEYNTYRIEFNGNGDDGTGYTPSMQMVIDTPKTLSSNGYYRPGYRFIGWNTKQDGSGRSFTDGQTVTNLVYDHKGTITLYAQWSANTFNITYIGNGGINIPLSETKQYDVIYNISNTIPSRDGYNFMGWSTSNGGEIEYQPGSSYNENADLTLYAIWSINSYTITYNGNGGSNIPSTGTKDHNITYTISTTIPSKNGYNFMGWATTNGGNVVYQPGDKYTGNNSLQLYAVWSAISYTITYNGNGGSNVPNKGTKYYGVDYTISSIIPIKDGYKFMGWATTIDGVVTYQAGDTYSNDNALSLYAIWSIDTYTNTINHLLRGFVNGEGNAESGTCYLLKSETFTNTYKLAINLGTYNAIPNIPNGITLHPQFCHVNENGGITYYNMGSTIYQQDSNMTFNFYYDPVEYPITYNLNGGNNNTSNPATYNILYGVTLEKPNKPGSRFSKWTDNKNVSITGINEGKTATFIDTNELQIELASRRIGAVSVYASWDSLGSTNIPNVGTYQCFIYRNGEWVLCAPHIVKNGAWEPY